MKKIPFETKEQWLQERLKVVTSTETPALFDMNPYVTLPELWHQKKNKEVVLLENNDRMFWGDVLEPAIAGGVGKKQNWAVAPFKIFGVMEDLKAGSSFDFVCDTPDGTGLLEIKNVDYLQIRDKWIIEDGEVIEAPSHIELQVQHQIMVTGFPFCWIAALEGGNKVHLLKRTPHPGIISAIENKIKKFWESIENNIQPAWKFERDASLIAKLHNHAEPGRIMDVTPERLDELALEYKAASEAETQAKKKKESAKAEMLTLIGENEKVLGENYTISAGVVGESEVSYTRKPFRNFRLHWKKQKENKK